MSPDAEFEKYRADQQRNATATSAAILALLRLVPANPTPAQWREFLDQAFVRVVKGRRAAFKLAERFYNATTPDNVKAPDLKVPRYTARDFAREMTPVKARITGLEEMVAEDAAAEKARAVIETETKNGGRDAISETAANDRNVLGWARVPESGHPCGFCVMLASRSGLKLPLYKSAGTARFKDGGGLYHDGCDCHPVPVYTFKSWPGKAANDAAARLWLDSTEGHSGTDALNALRRHIYAVQAS